MPTPPEKSGGLLFYYEFSGWSPDVPEAVEKSMSFYATYDKKFIFDTTQKNEESDDPVTEGEKPSDTEGNAGDKAHPSAAAATDAASVLAGIVSFLAVLSASWFIKRR